MIVSTAYRTVLGPGRSAVARFLFAPIVCWLAAQVAAVEPELKTIHPLGGSRGTTTEVVLSGTGFEQGGELHFGSPGITSEHIEKNRFRVLVSANSPLGDCDVWVATSAGLAGPRRFAVSDLPVLVEESANDSMDAAQPISVPAIVDGRFDSTDSDWFSFSGNAGQIVTISTRSKSLDGTAQPVVTLFGPLGLERAHSQAYRAEPVLNLRLPDSGEYRLLLRDRAYRGGDSSCYRLSIVTGPRMVQAIPHVIRARDANSTDGKVDVTLLGFELPGAKPYFESRLLQEWTVPDCTLERSPRQQACFLSTAAYMLQGSTLHHHSLNGAARVVFSAEPVVSDSEDELSGPQPISLPCRVAGQFQQRGDVDRFRFSAQKDDSLQVESFGERLDQWMDLEIAIQDADGKEITVLPDLAAPKGIPAELPLASLDAAGSWKVPADGEYDLVIRDLYGGSIFGPDRIYQLLLRRLTPAFHVVAMVPHDKPSRGVSLRRADSAELKLIAIRSGGFAGPIHVRALCPPQGVSVDPCTISEQEVTKTIKINAPASSPIGTHTLRLVAEAQIGSDKHVVPVRSAARVSADATRLTDGTVFQIRD